MTFEEMQDLSRFLEHVTEPAALLGPDGQTIPLPVEAFRVLCDVVEFNETGESSYYCPNRPTIDNPASSRFPGNQSPYIR